MGSLNYNSSMDTVNMDRTQRIILMHLMTMNVMNNAKIQMAAMHLLMNMEIKNMNMESMEITAIFMMEGHIQKEMALRIQNATSWI